MESTSSDVLFFLEMDMNWYDYFEYNQGKLYWKIKPSKRVAIGAEAGFRNKIGYVEICVNKTHYLAHTIIWEMHNGPIPQGYEVDHEDHIRHHNDISNLRLVTHAENQKNQSKSRRNTSGFNGVTWKKDRSKWHAQICVNGNKIHLGFFSDIQDAINARIAANKLYGFHNNHGS